MQFEPSEIKGMDWITDTTSQPSDWIFPFQLQMVNDQNHCVHAPSSSVKHAEEIDTETDLNLDVDLPPLPPSFMGDSCSILDHHLPENFDLILDQNWDPNNLIMQLEPSEMNSMDLIIDTISQPIIQFSDAVS
ncbi:hypothetical protein L1987_53843 [Smallanthus sonchifolius]|uniref:Uncharacterized protein n=1 Tax=Smallanthus sonchifolius TaxID=185202 RepID=A0ACB9EXF4_9ASTR|nr:hypothetical protein L1987_53843 [Smallanthus sonchifolius]